MISNEDYKNVKDSTDNGLNLLYQYYLANFGMRLSAGAFMIKFQNWCHKKAPKTNIHTAIEYIIQDLDIKHEYQGFIENWK